MSFIDLSEEDGDWWEDPIEYKRRGDELFAMLDREEREMPPEQKACLEEKQRERERILEARDKYVAAGLGEPMEHGFNLGPYSALKYPGGPVAVYEEAIRRGVTWEEVCGHEKPDLRYFNPSI